MMESYNLNIGGNELTLQKSPDIVALRSVSAAASSQLTAAAGSGGGQLLGQRLGVCAAEIDVIQSVGVNVVRR